MVDLLTAIGDFFTGAQKQILEGQISAAIIALATMHGKDNLDASYNALDTTIKTDPRVVSAYNDAVTRIAGEKDLGIFGSLPKALLDGFGALGTDIANGAASALSANLTGDSAGIGVALGLAMDPVIGMLLDALNRSGNPVPAEIGQKLKRSLLPILELGLTLEIATDITEFILPTKQVGFGGITHFIHDTIGFTALSNAYIFPVRNALIDTPTRYEVNSLLQPFYPMARQVATQYKSRAYTREQTEMVLRAAGIKEDYIQGRLNSVWTAPSFLNMLTIYETGAATEPCPPSVAEWLTSRGLGQYTGQKWFPVYSFALGGYSDANIPAMLTVLDQQLIKSEVGDIRALMKKKYADGRITRADYEAYLTAKGVDIKIADSVLDEIDDLNAQSTKSDLQGLYELKFTQGRMSEIALRTALTNLGVTDAAIDIRVKYLVEKKLGKLATSADTKTLTVTNITNAYSYGLQSKQWAIDQLDKMGYALSDAQLIMDIEDAVLLKVTKITPEVVPTLRTAVQITTTAAAKAAATAAAKAAATAAAKAAATAAKAAAKSAADTAKAISDAVDAVQVENIRAAELSAKDGYLSIEDLISVYLDNGRTQEWADARANYVQLLILGKSSTSGSV